MILEALRILLASILLVALPGWLLSRALFPRREALTLAERATVASAGGILLLMLVASILGFLPHGGGRGHFQSLATGSMPNLELAMLGTTALVTWIAIQRGAFPSLATRFPRLSEPLLKRGAQAPR